MRYYDHCFSGKEAVDWLSKNLKNNPRFGKNVTTEGTRKLLQHFLKSGVFQSVKGSLIFKESGLFEYVYCLYIYILFSSSCVALKKVFKLTRGLLKLIVNS